MENCHSLVWVSTNPILVKEKSLEFYWFLAKFTFGCIRVTPTASSCFRTAIKLRSCFSWVAPNTRSSSMWNKISARPSRNRFIFFWNNIGALNIPNSSLLKLLRPAGDTNIVSNLDSVDNNFCKNPLFASSFEKTVAPASWANISSTFGIGWTYTRHHSELLSPPRFSHFLIS